MSTRHALGTSDSVVDALMYAIESALHETLPIGIRPEVAVLNDTTLAVGTVQILIRCGAGLPDAKPAAASGSNGVPAAMIGGVLVGGGGGGACGGSLRCGCPACTRKGNA